MDSKKKGEKGKQAPIQERKNKKYFKKRLDNSISIMIYYKQRQGGKPLNVNLFTEVLI